MMTMRTMSARLYICPSNVPGKKAHWSIHLENTKVETSSWNVSVVATMQSIFGGASIFNKELFVWDVSNVIIMRKIL